MRQRVKGPFSLKVFWHANFVQYWNFSVNTENTQLRFYHSTSVFLSHVQQSSSLHISLKLNQWSGSLHESIQKENTPWEGNSFYHKIGVWDKRDELLPGGTPFSLPLHQLLMKEIFHPWQSSIFLFPSFWQHGELKHLLVF